MAFKYFSDDFVSVLKASIPRHMEWYKKSEFPDFILGDANKLGGVKTAALPFDLPVLDPSSGSPSHDAANVRIVFSSLKQLTRDQASDERLWSYMTHVHNWGYMQKRWSVEHTSSKDPVEFVNVRYFIKTKNSRWLIRNGMSRLWWFGNLTYSDADQWILTDILLELQDIQQTLLERSYGRNRNVLLSTLRVIAENRDALEARFKNEYGDLKKGYQRMGIDVGLLGGTSLLDAMPESQIERSIKRKYL